jgi:hypothetical protein
MYYKGRIYLVFIEVHVEVGIHYIEPISQLTDGPDFALMDLYIAFISCKNHDRHFSDEADSTIFLLKAYPLHKPICH